MKPRLVDVIEEMSLEPQVSDQLKSEFLSCFSDRDVIKLTEIFLEGIGSRHQVPGKLVFKLQGIAEFFYKNDSITREQRWLVFNSILENWDQINIISRTSLDL